MAVCKQIHTNCIQSDKAPCRYESAACRKTAQTKPSPPPPQTTPCRRLQKTFLEGPCHSTASVAAKSCVHGQRNAIRRNDRSHHDNPQFFNSPAMPRRPFCFFLIHLLPLFLSRNPTLPRLLCRTKRPCFPSVSLSSITPAARTQHRPYAPFCFHDGCVMQSPRQTTRRQPKAPMPAIFAKTKFDGPCRSGFCNPCRPTTPPAIKASIRFPFP